jgi:hypothetical protein
VKPHHRPVEGGVVRDDDVRRFDQGADALGINDLADHHLIGDAVDLAVLRRDREGGLAEGGKLGARIDAHDRSGVPLVLERQQRQFNDFVGVGFQSRCLGVDENAQSGFAARTLKAAQTPAPARAAASGNRGWPRSGARRR